MGTPQYMSPEQAEGKINELDARSDIFALGGILYCILTLQPPVEGKNLESVLDKVRGGTITPPTLVGTRVKRRVPGETAPAPVASDTAQDLPHIPGGRVPPALSAVAMKALSLDKAQRYQDVTALSADIEKYQGGFATSAEQAGLGTQLVLLVKRHKGIFTTAAAAWLLITALAVWFVFNLRAKEQRAVAGEQKATAAEAVAVTEKETARQALAKSQLDLAEKEFERGKFVEAQKILDETPESFRHANWRFLQAHSRDFTSEIPPGASRLRFLARGDRFVAKQFSGNIGVFALEGQQIGSWIQCPRTADDSIAIDTAGSRVAFSPAPKEIVVQEIATGNLLSRWTIEGDQVHRLVMSPDGATVLAESGGRLTAYDTPTGKIRWTQPSAGARSTCTSDWQMVAVLTSTAGLSLTVLIVEAQSGSVLKTLDALADNPKKTALQFNQAGDQLACLGGDEVILWNPRTAKRIRAFHFPGEEVMGLSPTGDVLATTVGNRIHLRETATGRLLRSLNGAGSAFEDVAFSPDGRILLSAHKYGKMKAWPIRLDEETARARPSTGAGEGVAFDIKGSSFNAIADKKLGSWESGSSLQKWTHPTEATHRFLDLAIHPTDGSILLACVGQQNLLHLSSQGAVLGSIVCKKSTVSRFELSSDGRFVAIAGNPCRVLAYPSGQESREFTFPGPKAHPMVAFCLDDTAVALAGIPFSTTGESGGITVWDWKANRLLYQIDPPTTGSINGLAASRDGRFLASCGPDRWIRIWEAATGELKSAFRADWEEVHCVKFSARWPRGSQRQ